MEVGKEGGCWGFFCDQSQESGPEGYLKLSPFISCKKKKEILPFATAGMDWEGMKLSEIGQSQKNKHGTIPLTQVTSNSPTQRS